MERVEEIEKGVHAVIASFATEEERSALSGAEHISDVCIKVGSECKNCFLYALDCEDLNNEENFAKVKTGILSALVN